ncbi:MAG: hypothetical protein PHC60_04470 [Heliobacteriaceae bacterium]|nr:hypothetical protein [Heliobacteriaceae bacterium]MDD4587634.1 hypothetical protein [Heliobacteriaceae bacterium]
MFLVERLTKCTPGSYNVVENTQVQPAYWWPRSVRQMAGRQQLNKSVLVHPSSGSVIVCGEPVWAGYSELGEAEKEDVHGHQERHR